MFKRLKSAAPRQAKPEMPDRPTTGPGNSFLAQQHTAPPPAKKPPGMMPSGMMPTDDKGFSLIPKGTNGLVTAGADLATDFIPGVSNVKDATAAITGVNPVTGERLNTFERIASGVFAIPGIGNAAKYVGKGGKLALKGLSAAAPFVAKHGSDLLKHGGNLLGGGMKMAGKGLDAAKGFVGKGLGAAKDYGSKGLKAVGDGFSWLKGKFGFGGKKPKGGAPQPKPPGNTKPPTPKKSRIKKLEPHPDAKGSHTSFKRGKDGRIEKYQEFNLDQRVPGGFRPGKRFDGKVGGSPHYNKKTGISHPTPHINDKSIPGGVRDPLPKELPKGY